MKTAPTRTRVQPPQRFRTNSFPGNCFTTRFISRLSKATLTAELGRPLRRITSSTRVAGSAGVPRSQSGAWGFSAGGSKV